MCLKDLQARREYMAQWRRDNAKAYRVVRQKREDSRRELLRTTKTKAGCMFCGVTDHRVLEFHHRDPLEKDFNVAARLSGSEETLMKEIAKCDVLCSNCHRIVEFEARSNSRIRRTERTTA